MTYPKVLNARAVDDRRLLIEFSNQMKKIYDITPLLEREMFAPLKVPALFRAVEVDQGGYAVVWGDSIDISEFELWQNGQEVD